VPILAGQDDKANASPRGPSHRAPPAAFKGGTLGQGRLDPRNTVDLAMCGAAGSGYRARP